MSKFIKLSNMIININDIKKIWVERYENGAGYRGTYYYEYYLTCNSDNTKYRITKRDYEEIESKLIK